MNTIQINPADNVIVALSPLAKGTARRGSRGG